MVTSKVRIINDLSFDPTTLRGTKGGLNLDIVTQDIPRCLCAEALPKFYGKIYIYQTQNLSLKSRRAGRVQKNESTLEHANKIFYVRDDLIVADLRLAFGWAGSPGFWGLLSSVVKHAHRNTFTRDAQILSEVDVPCNHCGTVERRRFSESTSQNRLQTLRWRGTAGSVFLSFLSDHVNDFMLVRVEHEPSDQTKLYVSASLASYRVRRRNVILSPKKSASWDTIVRALGYTTNTHTMRIPITTEKIAALRELLERE